MAQTAMKSAARSLMGPTEGEELLLEDIGELGELLGEGELHGM